MDTGQDILFCRSDWLPTLAVVKKTGFHDKEKNHKTVTPLIPSICEVLFQKCSSKFHKTKTQQNSTDDHQSHPILKWSPAELLQVIFDCKGKVLYIVQSAPGALAPHHKKEPTTLQEGGDQ